MENEVGSLCVASSPCDLFRTRKYSIKRQSQIEIIESREEKYVNKGEYPIDIQSIEEEYHERFNKRY